MENNIENKPIQMHTLPVMMGSQSDKIVQLQQIQPDNLEDIKLPYILPGKILMSPGVWNDYYYGSDAINDAYLKTAWNDKDVRALFLDHEDLKSSEWVGEVINPRMEGDTLIGDLVIVDKPTAIKLAYGAKMGISPKVSGHEEESTMLNFVYNNFSVVICPAIKTAYINNSEKSPYGDVPYADPGYQTDKKKRYPIDTEKHVRAAWSYINMPKNREPYTADQLKKIESKIKVAAKKFGIIIKNQEGNTMAEEEINKPAEEVAKPEAPKEEETTQPETQTEETSESKVSEPAEISEGGDVKEMSEIVSGMKADMSELKTMFTEMLSAIKTLATAKPAEAKVAEVAKPTETETKIDEMSAKLETKDKAIQELSQKVEKLEKVMDEPEKVTTKTAELSRQASVSDPDLAFLEMLKGEVPQ